MAWIESHDDIGDHKKTQKLSRILEIPIPTAVGHVHLLWHYTVRVAWRDGDLEGHSPAAIARACFYSGKPELFLSALQEAEFLDDWRVHGWETYARELIYQRQYNKSKRGTGVKKVEKTVPATPIPVEPKNPKKVKAAFIKPTQDQVTAYCKERARGVDPVRFYAFYEANGWKQKGGNPIKDWKMTVITWEKPRPDIKENTKRQCEMVALDYKALGWDKERTKSKLFELGYTGQEVGQALEKVYPNAGA